MRDSPVLYGIAKSGVRIPLSIAVSGTGSGHDRLFIAVVRDARSMNDTLHGMMALAETDSLTQLGNRRHLTSMLAEFENDPDRTLAILFLDLEQFKPLNDTYGHEAGDNVLRIIARRLRSSLRDCDHCIRLGGDEFAVALVGIEDPETLERVAQKVHARILEPINLGGSIVRIGVNIGGVIGCPFQTGGGALLKRADTAMYQAKNAGLPYCSFDPTRLAAA